MAGISQDVKNSAVMAHDLKAPLSAIVDLLTIIEKGYVDDPNKIRELISRARQKTETLITLVEDILDYTLLKNKTSIKREKLAIAPIIEESVSIIRPYALGRKISLDCCLQSCREKYVTGSYTFLLRAFNNVLMNAVKYNKDKGKVDIRCAENPDQTVSVEIRDTGIGISDDDLAHVFDIFSRGKEPRANSGGSLGLGLALVKQIVTDHDGSIDVSSTLGVGTTVTIKLPLYISGGKMKKKILDIDDDMDVLEARKTVLEHNNFDVVQAASIKVAAEILEKEHIDLIILDVMMEKESDGFNFAQSVKMNDKLKQIPIIMATAVGQRTKFTFDIETDGDFLPVEKFMEKPIDPDDLIKAINALLK